MKLARSPPTTDVRSSVEDDSPSEHIYIGSDEARDPETTARTVSARVTLRNPVRRCQTQLTLYSEGIVAVSDQRGGKTPKPFYLDLQYIDPVPTLERAIAGRWFYAALGCGGAAALAVLLTRFDVLRNAAWIAFGVAAIATLVTLFIGVYRSYEKTTFCTIHGRAPVLELIANIGAVRKFRAFVPTLSAAIEDSAEQIGHDTASFLRGEMREHYRLRGRGILTHETCAASTGRILAQFDVEI
jgi:hypothetical protein